MTDEQYDALMKCLQTVLDNQVVLDNKLGAIQRQQKESQSDIVVIIDNERILGRDQDKIQEDIDWIKREIKKLISQK